MIVATVVLAVVVVALAVGLGLFYRHSITPEWGDSDVRKSVLRMLIAIGPMLGMHYREPRSERPAVLTPKGDPEVELPGGDAEVDRRPQRRWDDGIRH